MCNELSIESLVKAAKEVYDDIKMQKVVVTQGVHESGLLSRRGPSKLAKLHNNLFGIKGTGTAGSATMKTWEHLKGRDVMVDAKFAKHNSYADSFRQHYRLMHRSRYKPVLEAKDEYEAFKELQKCGYATDPKYPVKLKSVYDKFIAKHF